MTRASSSPPLGERQVVSVTLDRVAQWMALLAAGTVVIVLVRAVLLLLAGQWPALVMSLLLAAVCGLQCLVWRATVRAELWITPQAVGRTGAKNLPNTASSWTLQQHQIAAATIHDGRRGPVLVVRPVAVAAIHASRWFQGLPAELSRGTVACPLDPAAVPAVRALLRQRGIPEIR